MNRFGYLYRLAAALGSRLLIVGLIATPVGCRSGGSLPDYGPAAYPPDFALVFTVRSRPDAKPRRDPEPRHRSAQHVLTSDRILRVALGPGVRADLYPPASAKVPIEKMALLYRLANAARLAATNPEPPPADRSARLPVPPTAAISCRLALTADDQHWAGKIRPHENAAATALFDELIRLRGGS